MRLALVVDAWIPNCEAIDGPPRLGYQLCSTPCAAHRRAALSSVAETANSSIIYKKQVPSLIVKVGHEWMTESATSRAARALRVPSAPTNWVEILG